MYGHLHIIFQGFIKSRFGDPAWQKISKDTFCPSDFEDTSVYSDDMTQKMITSACKVTGLARDVLLSMMGEYYLESIRKSGHEQLLANLGQDMLAFIQNLDYIHTYMMSQYPDINMPSFRCEADSSADRMTLHYYSFREGFHPMVVGMLKAVCKTFYNSELVMTMLSRDIIRVAEKNGRREHVVFSVSVANRAFQTAQEAPPTFIAQTRRNNERQILKKDIEHVLARLDQIRREHGEEALPLNRSRAVKAKWKSIAKMSVLLGGFVPQYPVTLSLTSRSFCNSFPYHVVFDSSMRIIHSGIKIQQALPPIRDQGANLCKYFEMLHPHSVDLTYENVINFINTPFVLKSIPPKVTLPMLKKTASCVPIIFRGQMVKIDDTQLVVYLCSPFVRSLKELEDLKIKLADIPMHDVTRDLLWFELMTRYHKNKAVTNKTTPPGSRPETTSRAAIILAATPAGLSSSSDELESLKQQLADTQADLEAERKKTTAIYQAFLPRSTAQLILAGHKPQAADYKQVTVLFADVVNFVTILRQCSANDAVNMLTKLHNKFLQICQVHNTYRIEAVGDAFMVVSGLPEFTTTHIERVANTALGMRIVSQEVTSPYDYGDGSSTVKIRIGIDSGPVKAGVVMEQVPRYLVLGDTVNMASKMESHGLPGRIHITQNVYDSLSGKNFSLVKRGSIDIRGKGQINTYFLSSNDDVTEEQLIGRPLKSPHNEVTFINEGKEEDPPRSSGSSGSRSPLLSRNRIYPGTDGSRRGSLDNQLITMMYKDSPRGTPLARPTPTSKKANKFLMT